MPGYISSYAQILMLLRISRLQETKLMHIEEQSEAEGLRKLLVLQILIILFSTLSSLWTGEYKHLTGCRSTPASDTRCWNSQGAPYPAQEEQSSLQDKFCSVRDKGTKLTCEKLPSLVQTRIPLDTSACEQKNCHLKKHLGFKTMSGGCCSLLHSVKEPWFQRHPEKPQLCRVPLL